VLGWIGADTVIVATDQEATGCDWEITVEGRGAACTT
jgi:hypothetical protein